jgi:hypothetical protein
LPEPVHIPPPWKDVRGIDVKGLKRTKNYEDSCTVAFHSTPAALNAGRVRRTYKPFQKFCFYLAIAMRRQKTLFLAGKKRKDKLNLRWARLGMFSHFLGGVFNLQTRKLKFCSQIMKYPLLQMTFIINFSKLLPDRIQKRIN